MHGRDPDAGGRAEHGETENIFGVVVITYTDGGANGVPRPLG